MTSDAIADWRAAAAVDVLSHREPLSEWAARVERELDHGQRLARPSEMRVLRHREQDEEWEP